MQLLNQSLYVLSIQEGQKLAVINFNITPILICSDSVTKVFSAFTLSKMALSVSFALHLVTAEALQGGADCASHQRCLTAATTAN